MPGANGSKRPEPRAARPPSDLMPHPLATLMTYGGTPIDSQALRFLSHKQRKSKPLKAARQRLVGTSCPYCGKIKSGLQAHIAAKHPVALIDSSPQSQPRQPATDSRKDLRSHTNQPVASPQLQPHLWAGIKMGPPEIPAWATIPPPQPKVKKRKPAVAAPKRTSRKKSGLKCQVCGERSAHLLLHMSQAHGLALIECPYCLAEVSVKKGGSRRCPECKKTFTVGIEGGLPGLRAECPNCYRDFYIAKLGRVQCPACRRHSWINAKGKPC